MKTLKKYALFSFAALTVFLVSCNKEDDTSSNNEINFSSEDAALLARADNIMEGSQNIVESAYVQTEEPGRMPSSFFAECANFTIMGGGGDGGTIIIDFGTGCQILNGAMVTGIINLEYGTLEEGARNIIYTYEDFTYNGNGVSGGGTINRVLENANGNPQSTVNETITISFTGTSVTGDRTALRIAEWIEGVGSGNWTDNAYSIDGNWETELSNGITRTGIVTTPLRRELNCLYLVSGELEVTQEGLTGALDFGDGDCDALATISFLGQEFPIILGN